MLKLISNQAALATTASNDGTDPSVSAVAFCCSL